MNNFSIESIYNWYRSAIRNPKYRWWMILGTLAYLFSPIDIAPDFIPIVGQIDDLLVVSLLVSELSQWLVDSFKSRQAKKVSEQPDYAASSGETVDVDSASVQ